MVSERGRKRVIVGVAIWCAFGRGGVASLWSWAFGVSVIFLVSNTSGPVKNVSYSRGYGRRSTDSISGLSLRFPINISRPWGVSYYGTA